MAITTTFGAISSPTTIWTGSVSALKYRVRAAALSCCSSDARFRVEFTRVKESDGSVLTPVIINIIASNSHMHFYERDVCGTIDTSYRIVTEIKYYCDQSICETTDSLKLKWEIGLYTGTDCTGSSVDIDVET